MKNKITLTSLLVSLNHTGRLCCTLLILTIFTNGLSAQWNLVGQAINGEADVDVWGVCVSLSADGSIIAAGAMANDGGGENSGHVRVFRNDCGMWVQEGEDLDGEASGDNAGWSVSVSANGSIVAIGAPNNDGAGINAGHVRVYQNIGGTWTQLGSDLDGEAANDNSGWSVALSDDGMTLAIGAYINDGSFPGAGHVRVYKYLSGAWVQQGADIDGEAQNDTSGDCVAISADGTTVAIGAPGNDGSGFLQGHARVYKFINGTWSQVGGDLDGDADLDFSGESVSLSSDGTIVAVGTPYNFSTGSNGNGYVKVYKIISGNWVQQGNRIDGEADGDYSGLSLSLSADGSKLAIGGYYNNGGGFWRGHVRVFRNVSGSWIQEGSDIDGEEDEEHSGQSVSLSSDGNTVATGAQYHSGGGGSRGQVRVFSQSGGNEGGDSDCDGVGDQCDVCPGGNDMVDNNEDGMPDCAILPLYNDIIADWKCANNKVFIAHHAGATCYTLCVNYNAAQAHLNHGDYLGPCNASNCNNENRSKTKSGPTFISNEHLQPYLNTDAPPTDFEVYPSPATDMVEINFTGLEENAILTLFTSNGVEVWRTKLDNGTRHLHLETNDFRATPSNGLYFAVLQNGGQTKIKPITILN